ncbi:hypothetical protein AU467_24270 [Mesorhizobium loti]|uniref:Uncharacterized protein n=1 Tax=Rhizobium loti TaxID=381 RepID=A0A117N346_RHILI|nr:hypothetical protein AU467_24270 [Mesorhizobium loti]
MIADTVISGSETDNMHTSRLASNDAIDAILNSHTFVGTNVHRGGSMEKEIGCWFAVRDHVRREDVRIEEVEQTSMLQFPTQSCGRAA